MARYGIPDAKWYQTVVHSTLVENLKPSPGSTDSNTWPRVQAIINLMTTWSLPSRRHRKSSKNQKNPVVMPTWRCWLIVTPLRKYLVASPDQRMLSRRTKTNIPFSSNLLKPSLAKGTQVKDRLRKLKYISKGAVWSSNEWCCSDATLFAKWEKVKKGEGCETTWEKILCGGIWWSALYQKSGIPETFCGSW